VHITAVAEAIRSIESKNRSVQRPALGLEVSPYVTLRARVPQSFPRSDHADTPRSWLAVAVAFIVGFVVFGILYSFGSFLDPMMTEFAASRTSVSALFSVSGLLFYLAGPIAGRFGDRFGPRPMVTSGALLLAAILG
jgi:predicted MFS family arabinose efflux permease